ncbi:hypothetical protein H671_6g15332 [Cricetulus griseus]|nr:hypothetical protein H671_6g15332 [Cricetulus griseus]
MGVKRTCCDGSCLTEHISMLGEGRKPCCPKDSTPELSSESLNLMADGHKPASQRKVEREKNTASTELSVRLY